MGQQTYTQCTFVQHIGEAEPKAVRMDIAWIPTEFAKVGKKLRIDGREGIWTVTAVGSTKSEKEALTDSRDYLKQREASDIKKAPRKLREKMRNESN